MKKSVKLALFIVVIMLQLGVSIYRITTYEIILDSGTEYRIKTAPVDPSDIFRGRYVALRFGNNSVTNNNVSFTGRFSKRFSKQRKNAYLSISKDSNDFLICNSISDQKPDAGDYFKVTHAYTDYRKTNIIHFTYPFSRYYMNEYLAPEAEAAYRKANRPQASKDTFITIKVKNGKAVLEELYIEEMPVKEYLASQIKVTP